MTQKKTALVLSGGGAKGAFQVGAEKYAREVRGYRWDVIAGVSIGAFNGAFIATRKHDALEKFWRELSPDRIYGRGVSRALHVLYRLARYRPSLYENDFLRDYLEREFDPQLLAADLRVGAVTLETGEYRSFKASQPHFTRAILASAALPLMLPPVDVDQHPRMIDGGMRRVSPIRDVLDAEPDEIVVINCNPVRHLPAKESPVSSLGIFQRAVDIALQDIFIKDVRQFLLVNRLVKQAAAGGVTLRREDGTPYRDIPNAIISPDEPTGNAMDMSQQHVERAFTAGWNVAKRILG